MMKLVMALALGTAAAIGAAAQDDPAPRRGGMGMMRADTNGDGVVTRAEYTAQVDARFARMDANGNGRLDADELPTRGMGRSGMSSSGMGSSGMGSSSMNRGPAMGSGEPRGGAMPPAVDTAPPSGSAPTRPAPLAVGMTRDQFRAVSMARFDRMDANRDGRLDAGEMPRFGRRGVPGGQPGAQPTPPTD